MAIYRRNGPIRTGELQAFIQPTLQLRINLSDLYRGGTNVPSQGPTGGTAGASQIVVDSSASSDATTQIEINLGEGVSPRTVEVNPGLTDAQGIADAITTQLNNHAQFYADAVAARSIRIEDSLERVITAPTVTVTTPGGTGLQASAFTSTLTIPGVAAFTRFTFNRNYDNLDVRPLSSGDWNFQSAAGSGGANIQPTAWPTAGNAFVAFREVPGNLLTAGGAFATFLGLSSFSATQNFTDLTLILTAGDNTITYPVPSINVIGQDLIATVTAGSSRDASGVPPANGTSTEFLWLRGTFGNINTGVPTTGTISLSNMYGVNDGEI